MATSLKRSCLVQSGLAGLLCGLAGLLAGVSPAWSSDGPHVGPLWDHFDLTLAPGERTELGGPLFYKQHTEEERLWAVPPFISLQRNPALQQKELDILFPLMTYDRYGHEYRWQLGQVLSFSGGDTLEDAHRKRFTLFPLYTQQRSTVPKENYTALFPFYGHLENRLFRDEMTFVMFPGYLETRKRDVVTDNYLFPIVHVRHGVQLKGWQVWPLAGNEHKDIGSRTNGFGDVSVWPGHDKFFALWPLYMNEKRDLGTTNPVWELDSLPLFSVTRSPLRDGTIVLWPFFQKVEDRGEKYREWDLPWPLIVFARGEGKTTTRVWPFYSKAHNASQESDFYLWPIYKYNHAHMETLDRERHRILFYVYNNIVDKNLETGHYRQRVDLWPLYLKHRDFDGNSRVQVLALIETLLPGSQKIERDWSPLWSLWRAQNNPTTGARSQSLLWNLYRHESRPEVTRTSVLLGLGQFEHGPRGRRLRLFHLPAIPLGGGPRVVKPVAAPEVVPPPAAEAVQPK